METPTTPLADKKLRIARAVAYDVDANGRSFNAAVDRASAVLGVKRAAIIECVASAVRSECAAGAR